MEDSFAMYYSKVYASSGSRSASESKELLSNFKLPTITEEENLALEAKVTPEEIEQAIHGLSSGKALGPNGIPIELYKSQSGIVAPYLLQMFLDSREMGILPEEQPLATIVLIHKEGKPRNDCIGYRPISLLNER